MSERRLCAVPGCGREFMDRSRHRYCLAHRGSRPVGAGHNTKYGWSHWRLRADIALGSRWAREVCTGAASRSSRPTSGTLGMSDGAGARSYSGPEHSRCNRATAGRNGEAASKWAHLEAKVPFEIVRCGECGWNIKNGDSWRTGVQGLSMRCVCGSRIRPALRMGRGSERRAVSPLRALAPRWLTGLRYPSRKSALAAPAPDHLTARGERVFGLGLWLVDAAPGVVAADVHGEGHDVLGARLVFRWCISNVARPGLPRM